MTVYNRLSHVTCVLLPGRRLHSKNAWMAKSSLDTPAPNFTRSVLRSTAARTRSAGRYEFCCS